MKFTEGTLVFYNMLPGIFNVFATKEKAFQGQFPNDGCDYIIQQIDKQINPKKENPFYHVKEEQLTLRTA